MFEPQYRDSWAEKRPWRGLEAWSIWSVRSELRRAIKAGLVRYEPLPPDKATTTLMGFYRLVERGPSEHCALQHRRKEES